MPVVRPLLIAVVFALFGSAARAESVRPAWRETVTITHDGKLTPEEWDGATVLEYGPSFITHWLQTSDDVFLGVRIRAAYVPYVDIFVGAEDKRVFNLHASMQLGERELTGVTDWTDRTPATHWGVTHHWMSNAISVDKSAPGAASLKRRVARYEGFEVRISKSKFAGTSWRMRVEVRDVEKMASNMGLPFGSKRHIPTTWLEVDLTPPGAPGSPTEAKPASPDATPAPSAAPVSGDAKPTEPKPSDPKPGEKKEEPKNP